jgi:hypothetical protein
MPHRAAGVLAIGAAVVVALTALTALAAPRPARADRPAPPPTGETAVAIVIEGHIMFMRGAYTTGAGPAPYAVLRDAIDRLADDAPPGALAAVVTYGRDVRVRRAMGPMATLDRDVLGAIEEYDDQIERDLAAGVAAGIDELAASGARHRALVIVGDGHATDPRRAAAVLRDLRARCETLGIEVYAIVRPLELDDDFPAIGQVASRIRRVEAAGELAAAFRDTFRELGSDVIATRARGARGGGAGTGAGGSSDLAWALLGGGLAVGAIGAGVIVRRRMRAP